MCVTGPHSNRGHKKQTKLKEHIHHLKCNPHPTPSWSRNASLDIPDCAIYLSMSRPRRMKTSPKFLKHATCSITFPIQKIVPFALHFGVLCHFYYNFWVASDCSMEGFPLTYSAFLIGLVGSRSLWVTVTWISAEYIDEDLLHQKKTLCCWLAITPSPYPF